MKTVRPLLNNFSLNSQKESFPENPSSGPFPIDPALWLKEGFLIQTSENKFFLGQGPFRASRRPCRGLYHPDFFFENPAPWLSPRALWEANRKDLRGFFKSFQAKRNGFFRENPRGKLTGENSGIFPGDSMGLFPKKTEKKIRRKTAESFAPHKPGESGYKVFRADTAPSFAEFQQVFCRIQNKIKAGALQKAVPAFCEVMKGRPDLPALLYKLFKGAESAPKSGFLYGAWSEKKGVAGKTPEIFFTLKGRDFRAMALAGTAPHPGPSLLRDPKEMREHFLTAQTIKESLKGLVLWKNETRFEKIFPPIKHLCTEMQGELAAPFDFSLFCERLHPTGALGGFPQKQAFQWLKREPSQNRRRIFGAPIGLFEEGFPNGSARAFCLVAIRGLEWSETETRLYSGAGVIRESALQKEWRELFLKREQVKSFFL